MTLHDILNDPILHARFVRDAGALLDAEVASKSGLSGMAIKAGFSAMKAVKPGIVPAAIEMLLPAFAPAVEPHFAAGRSAGDLPGHFTRHASAIADALLQVTDAKAAVAKNAVLKKTYQSLRGMAHQHTTAAMPATGRLLATYA
jgi:hypothetical protein